MRGACAGLVLALAVSPMAAHAQFAPSAPDNSRVITPQNYRGPITEGLWRVQAVQADATRVVCEARADGNGKDGPYALHLRVAPDESILFLTHPGPDFPDIAGLVIRLDGKGWRRVDIAGQLAYADPGGPQIRAAVVVAPEPFWRGDLAPAMDRAWTMEVEVGPRIFAFGVRGFRQVVAAMDECAAFIARLPKN